MISKIRFGAASLAEHINLNVSQVYRLIETKRIPTGRLGTKIVWSPAKVDAALERLAAGESAS